MQSRRLKWRLEQRLFKHIVRQLAIVIGFNDRSLYKHKDIVDRDGQQTTAYYLLLKGIKGEIKCSNEDFIKHYYSKYDNPPLPPAWMTLEVLSLGTLSKLYQLLKK